KNELLLCLQLYILLNLNHLALLLFSAKITSLKMFKNDNCHLIQMKYKSFLLVIIITLFNCKNEPKNQIVEALNGKELPLKYAKGFSVTDFGTYKILEIKNPWPKAEKVFKYIIISKEHAAKTTFQK